VDGYINTTYLGPLASDPATRPGGAALQTGDQYFNTTQNIVKVWTGTVWVISAAAGNIVRWRKTASAGNTTLSGVDDLGVTLSYVVGNEQVYLNGALQTRGVDYTAGTGTSITLTPALLAGDVVELHAVQGYVSATITPGSINDALVAPAAGIQATKLAFTQAGTGAVARTVDSKLEDVVSVKDFGAVGDGVTNDTAAIQAALTYASSIYATVLFPTGTYLVSATLNAGNASIQGGDSGQATIKYTGSSNLFGAVTAKGIAFEGPGKGTASIGILIVDGYRNLIERCFFTKFGSAIKLSGSGQKICESLFYECGYGVWVVKYSTNDPTTTFTSEKNWYENCNRGLWIDSTGTTGGGGFISCTSKDDIFQLNTGYGLVVNKAGFPFSLINPHTEQNSITAGNYAFGFTDSPITWIGGYQAGSDVNLINSASQVHRYGFGGVFAYSPYNVYNSSGSIQFLQVNPSTPSLTFPCNPVTQQILYSGGGYGSTNSARVEYQGGRGDNGFAYGSFIESERTSAFGHGVNTYIGTITAGSPDTYARQFCINRLGTVFPVNDNSQALGGPSNRWSVVYAGTGTINTSDANEKQQIEELSEAERNVAKAIKGLIRKFKFNDAVAAKGDNARIHVGVIAQDVEQAFIDEGLDPVEYGLFCCDEWWELDGKIVNKDTDRAIRKERLGIRYEELLAFIISTL
jgi:hypothetical protein